MSGMTWMKAAWSVLQELSPWLFLGVLGAILLHRVLPRDFAQRALTGRFSVLRAVAIGLPLPLCSCGVLPTGLGLWKSGAGKGASVGFLISTPQTGLDSVFVSASFLGWPFALAKLGVAGLTGLVGGWMTDAIEPSESSVEAAPEKGRPSWKAAWAHGLDLLRMVIPWVSIGIIVSATLDVLVPGEAWTAMQSWGLWPAMSAALLLSLPLYVCATGSVPIAATLVAHGFPVGAALVFLMAGPATNLGTLGALWNQLGVRATLVYLAVIVAGSLGFGALLSWVLSPDVVAAEHAMQHGLFATLCALVMLGFVAEAIWNWLRDRLQSSMSAAGGAAGHRFDVEGMTCGGCSKKVQRALHATRGVESVEVDVASGLVLVRGDADPKELAAAIRGAGYGVGRTQTTELQAAT